MLQAFGFEAELRRQSGVGLGKGEKGLPLDFQVLGFSRNHYCGLYTGKGPGGRRRSGLVDMASAGIRGVRAHSGMAGAPGEV